MSASETPSFSPDPMSEEEPMEEMHLVPLYRRPKDERAQIDIASIETRSGPCGCAEHGRIHCRNTCGTYQRAQGATPDKSTTHQSTSTVRIQSLYLVIRSFSGNTLVPAASRMYNPAISVIVPSAACAVASA